MTAPPGTRAVVIPGAFAAEVSCGTENWKSEGRVFSPTVPLEKSEEITIRMRGHEALFGPAELDSPIRFICGPGVMNVDKPIEEQGLKHYSGGVRYSKVIHLNDLSIPVMLRFQTLDCSARIWVNGVEAGVLVAPPYELDITAFIGCGDNRIEVLIHNTLRNHMRTIPTNFLFEK